MKPVLRGSTWRYAINHEDGDGPIALNSSRNYPLWIRYRFRAFSVFYELRIRTEIQSTNIHSEYPLFRKLNALRGILMKGSLGKWPRRRWERHLYPIDGILSPSGLFSVSMEPNKWSGDTESEGKSKVYIKLCTFPIGITALKGKYKIIAPELGEVRSFTKTLNYDTQHWGGAMGNFQDLSLIKSMKIMAETEILKVFDANGNKKKNIQFQGDGMCSIYKSYEILWVIVSRSSSGPVSIGT